MKAAEIKVGGIYWASVSGKKVRVTCRRQAERGLPQWSQTEGTNTVHGTNLAKTEPWYSGLRCVSSEPLRMSLIRTRISKMANPRKRTDSASLHPL
jgi:hypothetical protein